MKNLSKLLIVSSIAFAGSFAQAKSNCQYKAEKAFAAVSLLEINLSYPKNPITVLPETTAMAGEGTMVPVENYRAMVGEITSADVSMYKESCEILKIEISYGE